MAGIYKFAQSIQNPFAGFAEINSNNLMAMYLKNVGLFSILFAIFFVIGVAKSAPKMSIQILNMVQVIGAKMENNIQF